jgi:FKBP-type peptidyl-prolyl cis-trans isomerase FkpA
MRVIVFLVAATAALMTAACGNDNPAGPSGVDIPTLVVTDVVVGTGTEATTGRNVSVHYTLWLYSATAADHRGARQESSRDRNQPLPFVLGTQGIIAGWNQGVAGMRVGGMRTLFVPSSLAYGAAGKSPSIPPNSALVFDIELLSVQ